MHHTIPPFAHIVENLKSMFWKPPLTTQLDEHDDEDERGKERQRGRELEGLTEYERDIL